MTRRHRNSQVLRQYRSHRCQTEIPAAPDHHLHFHPHRMRGSPYLREDTV